MRFPWDEDDPQVRGRIQANLAVLFFDIVASGRRRDPLTIDLVKDWHQLMLGGVPLPQPEVAGGFRGSGPQEGRLRTYRVTVDGILQAVPPRAGPIQDEHLRASHAREDYGPRSVDPCKGPSRRARRAGARAVRL